MKISIPTDFMEPLDWPDIDFWIVDPDVRVMKGSLWKGLQLIVTASTGIDHIDMDACKEAGIDVLSLLDDRGSLEDISGSSEFTFFLILATLRKLHTWAWAIERKKWGRMRRLQRGYEMQGRSMGIVGRGRIGSNVYKWARAFGVDDIVFHDPPKGMSGKLRDVFSKDIVCISCELTEATTHLINGDLIALLPENAVVVNTSRGEVMDEFSVAEALKYRKDVIMAVDVLEGEWRRPVRSPLLDMDNVIVTPHLAGLTYEANEKAYRIANSLVWKWAKEHAIL